MKFSLTHIQELTGAQLSSQLPINDLVIKYVETDSRMPIRPNALFVALDGPNYHGADFLKEAFQKGATAAICNKVPDDLGSNAPVLVVEDTLAALRHIAGAWRQCIDQPLLAITGSNGKTMLKDFLARLLTPHMSLDKSPGSFNSHVGIAHSLLRLKPKKQLALIEVGVSSRGEMVLKEAMVAPTHGIFTNVGLAHFEGFGSREMIAEEKMKLFQHIAEDGWVLLPHDPLIIPLAERLKCRVFFINKDKQLPRITAEHNLGSGHSALEITYPQGQVYSLTLPIDFAFREVFETILAGLSAAHMLGIDADDVMERAADYKPPMGRIEIWKSSMGSVLVNDAYSADPVSTRACLRVFSEHPKRRKVFVFGGMGELGDRDAYENRIVAEELARQKVDVLLTVGPLGKKVVEPYLEHYPQGEVHSFENVRDFIDFAEGFTREGDVIAVKGPRSLNLEQVSVHFKARLTQSVYYIDLDRIDQNLITWRQHLAPGTRILAMIKALAYGADAVQIAAFLQSRVDFFGVAYTKEAVVLRQNGIYTDILVQLVLPEDCEDVVRLNLQPVILERNVALRLSEVAQARNKEIKVHLEIDTGMGRFGVFPEEALAMARLIDELPGLKLNGLMMHFSSADDAEADAFSREQIRRFQSCVKCLKDAGFQPPLLHAAATAAAARFPEAHFNMVRIGLGIYGIYPSDAVARSIDLKCPLALVSKIGSIKSYPKGFPISYNRTYITRRESRIAYLPIGYHDGLSRRWGKGWSVMICGKKAPIVGAVCMDFTPVDVTDIPGVKVGDEALIFGEWHGVRNPVEDLAQLEGTIPYEVLCRLSHRIQRIYHRDDPG